MGRISAEKRKDEIIDAALSLFKEKGMASSSTRDVAGKTGLVRSHIYHYFKDWKELCLCTIERFGYNETSRLKDSLASLTPKQALVLFIQDSLPKNDDASWSIYLDAWNESLHDPIFAQRYRSIINAWQSVLTTVISEGMDCGDFSCTDAQRVSRQIIALINGYADDLILAHSNINVDMAYQEIISITEFLTGSRMKD